MYIPASDPWWIVSDGARLVVTQKAQQRLKLLVAPSLERLQVYRWAQQALATPPDHPLLPLVWQRFLQLYLRQPGPDYGYV